MRVFLLFTLVFITLYAAQASTGGSAYSLFGIGDIRDFPSVRSAGMGFANLALPSPNAINGMQPATWSKINRVRLEAGLLYEGFKSSDGSRSLYLANSDFNGALLAIPISPANGITTVLGFIPYSNVNYNLFEQGSQEGIDYQMNYAGTGGVSKGIVGLSYTPFTDIAIGSSFNYLFGTIDRTTTFSPTNTANAGALTATSMTLKAISVTVGLQFVGLGRISESLQPFSLGLVFSTGGSFRTERQLRYEFLSEKDTLASVNGRMSLPAAYGIGLAYQPSERYLFAADYTIQPWGNITIDGVKASNIRNSFRYSIGGEQLPSRDPSGWFGRLTYRLGFYYHATYYNINGQPINEWGATAGAGIPLFGDARLNAAFEYGSRGATNYGLIKDNIFRMSLSVTLSESWFQRYEEE